MQLIGLARLGRDAELRYLPNGDAIANLSLAFNYGKKGEDGQKPTQWVDATLWGKHAENMAPHLTRGKALVVTIDEPHIQTYDKRDGSQGVKLTGKVSLIEYASREGGEQRQAQPASTKPAPEPFNDDDIPY